MFDYCFGILCAVGYFVRLGLGFVLWVVAAFDFCCTSWLVLWLHSGCLDFRGRDFSGLSGLHGFVVFVGFNLPFLVCWRVGIIRVFGAFLP